MFFISGFHFVTYPVFIHSRLTNEIGMLLLLLVFVFIQFLPFSDGVLLLFIIRLWLVLSVCFLLLLSLVPLCICSVIIGIKQG